MPQEQNRRTVLKGASAAIGLTTIAGCMGGNGNGNGNGDGNGNGNGNGGGTTRYVFGAGSEGSGTFATGQAIQSVIREHSENISVTAQTTGGTLANMRQYDRGTVDFFGASNYAAVAAKEGREPFGGDNSIDEVAYQGWRDAVANNFVVARADTDIESYSDLAGKNVWPLWEAASLRFTTEIAFRQMGLMDKINEVALNPPDLAGALQEGSVDAAVVYGIDSRIIPGWVTEVDSRADLKHVPMGEEEKEAIDSVDVPGRMQLDPVDLGFENNLQDVGEINAWTDPFQVFIGKDMPAEDVYQIIDTLHENADQVEEVDAGSFHYGDPERLAETTIPSLGVHPGVKDWFQDKGVWDDSWSTEHP